MLAGALAVVTVVGCNNASERKDETQANQTMQPAEHAAPPASTESQPDTIRKSIPSETAGKIGEANLKINYHSPGVKGRVIWGGLVPYDQVWVTGAHRATTLETDKNLTIGGKKLGAGKYALFTIPGKENWTVIINKNWEQHLADDYAQQEDVVRVQVTPQTLQSPQERLKYDIKGGPGNTGTIDISWADLLVSVPVKS